LQWNAGGRDIELTDHLEGGAATVSATACLGCEGRSLNPEPTWPEYVCAENNEQVRVGQETYMISADGYLMPTRRDQPPPDPRYFRPPQR
jgi:hypothetical protein